MTILNTVHSLFHHTANNNVCIVAILKDEDKFIEEWLIYHRLLGADHFYLYDNDPRLPLKELTRLHQDYVTTIDWLVEHDDPSYPGQTKQIKAYNHFLKNFAGNHQWVAFIDADEFITLRKHRNLKTFLQDFNQFDAVSLNWHVFGHNGHYDDPADLLLASLTRRMAAPSPQIKTINKTKSIDLIRSAHHAELKLGSLRVDANKKKFDNALYPGKTKTAHINHYQCKSFTHWMSRPDRGDVACDPQDKDNAWRFAQEKCLNQFVTSIARNKNEFVDEYMLRYIPLIKNYSLALKNKSMKTSSIMLQTFESLKNRWNFWFNIFFNRRIPPSPFVQRHANSSTLRIGWILNGNLESASSRIMGHNVHNYLTHKNIFSKILFQPEARITSILRMSRQQIDKIFDQNFNILVIVKIFKGDNLDYLLKKCKKQNVKIVYAVCDLPSPKMLEYADVIIGTSQYFYQIMPKRYHKNLHIVFDGYEQSPELLKTHTSETKIKLCLVTGRAWDEVPCLDRLPMNVSLKIIGPNSSILEVVQKKSLVFRLSKFDFTYVAWDINTVYQEILDCDVGIIPWAQIGEEEKIKSANRLIMLMALGLPVVASPLPAYLEIIRHNENGFIAQTPSDWINDITLLRDSPQKRKEIGKAARETVLEKYSKEKQCELYLDIFKKTLNN